MGSDGDADSLMNTSMACIYVHGWQKVWIIRDIYGRLHILPIMPISDALPATYSDLLMMRGTNTGLVSSGARSDQQIVPTPKMQSSREQINLCCKEHGRRNSVKSASS
jgi:hypothetical protein